MKSRLEGVLSGLLTLAALVMAGAIVKREFFGRSGGAAVSERRPEFHDEWVQARAVGIELANPRAALQLVEFLDIECAACALYHERALEPFIRSVDPADYSLVVVHRPLGMHEFAVPAAQAADCAYAQGAFFSFVRSALDSQSTFARSPWLAIAVEAGVKDTARFSSCLKDERQHSRVAAGNDLAVRMGVNATPTIVVNGWELPVPPDLDALRRYVDQVKAGRDIREVLRLR